MSNSYGLRELTPGFRPHTYYLNKEGKCVAYKKDSDGVVTVFSRPLFFSKSFRTFEKIFDEESRNFVC